MVSNIENKKKKRRKIPLIRISTVNAETLETISKNKELPLQYCTIPPPIEIYRRKQIYRIADTVSNDPLSGGPRETRSIFAEHGRVSQTHHSGRLKGE